MSRILEQHQQRLLNDERRHLRSVLLRLSEAGAPREELQTLELSIEQLEHLFLLVVVGEFNSGKSSLINALVGQPILPDGVTPTTQRIHRLQYGEAQSQEIGASGIELIEAPIEVLKELSIVDTPGTNALDREHETITTEFVPRADLILFVTSADRPYTESERKFMESIRSWGKKLIIVINKIDILTSRAEVQEVEQFVAERSMRILDHQPHIFAVSARAALAAKRNPVEIPLDAGFGTLEKYLYETLDDSEKLRLKLGNPLGVAQRLTGATIAASRSRLDLLGHDTGTLVDVEQQLEHYKDDMGREFRFRLSDVDTILRDLERRGVDFFDETLRLPRVLDLMNTSKVQGDFERRVIGDAPQQIDRKIQEIIDWMVASELRQWHSIGTALEKRREIHRERLVGTISTFDYDRERLLDTVGRAARKSIDAFDEKSQAERMAESVRNAVAGAALIEVGAVSLGTVVTLLATTHFADFTGLLAAGTLAVLGLMVLPARKRRAKRELTSKIGRLRRDLMRSLTEQFDHEIEGSLLRISEAIAPYSRFVRAESARLEENIDKLEECRREIQGLEARIAQL